MLKKTFILISILFVSFVVKAQDIPHSQMKFLEDAKIVASHPRILLLTGEEQKIKETIKADTLWARIHQVIIDECENIIKLPVSERRKIGKRLLFVSQEALRRIFYLSYAYRMEGQKKYLDHAEKEMLAISAFSDWNPSHFLDVGEMTMALAIGYDWLYSSLSESSREIIKKAILQKGIDPSYGKDGWFLDSEHNWNQVCNAGISYGALAIHEDLPELTKMIIDRSIESIHKPMADYGPDGNYPEGYGYWEYGTSFNVMFLEAIQKAFGSDFGLTKLPGFMNTAFFRESMLGPINWNFNYGDAGQGGGFSSTMFWFSSKLNDPSLLWNEKQYIQDYSRFTRNRLLPALMIWAGNIRMNDIQPPKNNMFVGRGRTNISLMRTAWADPNAIFIGFKGGSPSSNHAHMDAGSFVMDANGVRWASDFGSQNYESLESKGVDLWNRKQESGRWQVFRYNNFVHNTLTIDNQLHRVDGFATITSHSSNPDFMNTVINLSPTFKGQLAESNRGVAIVDKQYVVVRDEIRTLDKETNVRWTMLTSADVKIAGKNTIELKKDGKKLKLQVVEPANVTMKTWTTVPPNEYDAPNPGTTLIGFEVKVPANSNAALLVKLIPQNVTKTTAIPELAQWPKSN